VKRLAKPGKIVKLRDNRAWEREHTQDARDGKEVSGCVPRWLARVC
jgi:hypothetical protein